MAMFNPNPEIAMQSGLNAPAATQENASGKNFETNQHRVPYTRFQNNDSRQNSRQFNGSQGRGRGALSGRDGGRGLRDRRDLAPEYINSGPLKINKKRKNKKKRWPTITYDEKEIKQWLEARKRNFPTTANIKKKLAAKNKRAENEDDDTEFRRKEMPYQMKSTNPFDFPDESDVAYSTFMDMSSLQAALSAQQPAADFYSTSAYGSEFYTQNPASTYASPMPQGGISQTIDQAPNPQILNSILQGYPSLGSNPFA